MRWAIRYAAEHLFLLLSLPVSLDITFVRIVAEFEPG